MSKEIATAAAALIGAIIGGAVTVAAQLIQIGQLEDARRTEAILETAIAHYEADNRRILETNRLRGLPLASFADYVSYHTEVYAAGESNTLSSDTDEDLQQRYPRLNPDYLSVVE